MGLISHLAHSRTIGRSSLQRLKLVNCGIQDEQTEEFCQYTQLSLDELSLSRNAGVSSEGIARILRSDNVRCLDATECGIDSVEPLTSALDASSTIRELVLSRNYAITKSDAFLSFFAVASKKLSHLDVSFCNVSGHHLKDMFQILKRTACRLESLNVDGCRHIPGPGLCEMLSSNHSLRHLILRSKESRRQQIPLACYYEMSDRLLERNYSIRTLKTGDALPPNFEFVLAINRAGRSILQEGGDWTQVLANASNRTDALYWLIRNGAGAWWSPQNLRKACTDR